MIECPRCGHTNDIGARFCSSCGVGLDTGSSQTGEVRKTVTVMFMDAADSTGIGERADPEALRRVMSRYFDEIRSIVEHHGGVVEKYIGDAVMAVFGVPVVHEDDALRAVRAAAQIRSRNSVLGAELERDRGLSISWRTGINTGEVVAGDAGSGQRFVSGDAVNVAARLEQAAAAGEVLIGVETYRLVRDLVSVEPVEPISAKGKTDPVPAYRLTEVALGASGPARRLDAPMVGRQRQRRLLSDAFEQAVEERICHLFTILGAAGVGKSRLVSEFLGSLEPEVQVLHGRCLSYGEGITMWPIAEAIRQAAGLGELDDDEAIRAKVGALIDDDRDRDMVVERIGAIFGRSSGGAAAEETYWAVRTLLQSLARRAPVVLHLDDIHWAEEALLDLIEHLAEWTRDTPLLLVCLARQELLEIRPGWGGGKQHATTLTLEPLSASETGELMENLLGEADTDAGLSAKIAAAAEGNPLFIEEMVGMLIDQGVLVRGQAGWTPVGDLASVAVPPTIQALLAARLDRLSRPERAVIERGAVEGKVFHRSAVAELAPDDVRASVADQLRSLSRKELVRPDRSDFAGDEAFRFRHLLIRDAAYGAMPKEARADLHARFARWLTRMAGDHVTEYEEILGYHLEQAYRYRAELGPLDAESRALGAEAATRLGAAAQRALDRDDVAAAIKLLSPAVDLAQQEVQRSRLQVDLSLALSLGGGLDEAQRLVTEAMETSVRTGDELGQALAEVAQIDLLTIRGEMSIEEVIERSGALLTVFDRHGHERGSRRAVVELARHHFFAGRAQVAEEIIARRLERYPADKAPDLSRWLPAILTFGPTPSGEAIERLLLLRDRSRSRLVEAQILSSLGLLWAYRGDFADARAYAQRSVAMLVELGMHRMAATHAGNFLGTIEELAGDVAQAEQVLVGAYDQLRSLGDRTFASTIAGRTAHLMIAAGRPEDAQRFAEHAFETATDDDVDAQVRALSARARVRASQGDAQGAVEDARRAVELADSTDYLDMRGEAHADLAEVLLATGDIEAAQAELVRAIENFEAKDAPILVERARRRLAAINLELS